MLGFVPLPNLRKSFVLIYQTHVITMNPVCQGIEFDGKKSKPCQYFVTFNQYHL